MTSPKVTQDLAAVSFLSPCATRAFDVHANGYCRGEDAGLVVLRPLQDAIRNGDPILAVNQGSNRSPVTVPDSESQIFLYRTALAASAVAPKEVTYVEAHGTGTQVGDTIEFDSIRRTFGAIDRMGKLHVGSVKDDIRHTETSSGVAALLKTALSLGQRQGHCATAPGTKYLPIWFQTIKGVTAVKSGIMNLPLLPAVVICSTGGGGLASLSGYYLPIVILGTVVATVGSGMLTTMHPDSGHSEWIGYQAFFSWHWLWAGCAIALWPLQLNEEKTDIPVVTALVSLFQTLGGAVGRCLWLAVSRCYHDSRPRRYGFGGCCDTGLK